MTSPPSPSLDSIGSKILPTPFVKNYSPPGSTDGIVGDDQVSRSSGEDSAATHTESRLHSASSSSTTSQSSDGSGTDRSDASKEQSLLVGVDGVQRKRYRIPSGENVNVADHEEATSEKQIDGDPACNPGATAPDPIAAPDEQQFMTRARETCSGTRSSSSETCDVDEHRECPVMTENSNTVTIKRKKIHDSIIWTKGKSISPRIKIPIYIGCRRRRNPCMHLDIIPCKDRHSRHVKIKGNLKISKRCSRYKWLVQYCKCSIIVAVKVFNPTNNTELCSVNQKYDIIKHCDSELNQDHETDIELDILDHESIIYNYSSDITKISFKVTVQLIQQGANHCAPFDYSVRIGEDNNFTDIIYHR